ncbi:hypothetical protein T492DRAFT_1140357 [Pavlovales sp. CCMP2436]|nr:hypothetical protein T492DRAFT_1140357 [Pavlovales sp. CCMP2436]|mmetsp:Transcript_32904/g.81784  ORF Transcript_32904/g.81784 Transcript_32904/m.81784 type:complete len:314 (+) Transcript_32904:38-979(+)
MAPAKKSVMIAGLNGPHPRSVAEFRPADWTPNLIASGLSAEPLTLHYFAIRGLGELPRLMLELAQMPYDSVMYWDTKEFKDLAPFGQMPLLMGGDLDTQDTVLCQSSTIVRYIAKESHLDGSEQGAVGEGRADMVFECSKDLSSNKNAIHATIDAEKEKLHGMLKKAEEMLDEFEGPFFSGMTVTYADVGMFHVLSTIEELKPGYLKSNDFAELSDFVTLFAELPAIAAYLTSGRRMPLTANEVGDVPWAADGYKYKGAGIQADLYAEYVERVYSLGGDDDSEEDDEDDSEMEEVEEEEEVGAKRPAAKKAKK